MLSSSFANIIVVRSPFIREAGSRDMFVAFGKRVSIVDIDLRMMDSKIKAVSSISGKL